MLLQQPRRNLDECTIHELECYVDCALRQKSEKTGKLVKINTYKWRKDDFVTLLTKGNLVEHCLSYVNGWYHDLPGYEYDGKMYMYVKKTA